jgi:hypothetical protein
MAELNDRQRKLAFAGLVVALAFVGIYLTLPSPGHSSHHRNSTASRPVPSTQIPDAPTAAPSGIPSPISPNTFNIYSLLPFSQADAAAAAGVAQQFMVATETYAYNENPQAYAQRLEALAFSDLSSQIVQSGPTPATIQRRNQTHEVSQGTASVDALTGFGGSSITFLVTGHQQITNTSGTSQQSPQLRITVAKTNASWLVYSYELPNQGQDGVAPGSGQG